MRENKRAAIIKRQQEISELIDLGTADTVPRRVKTSLLSTAKKIIQVGFIQLSGWDFRESIRFFLLSDVLKVRLWIAGSISDVKQQ